MNYRIGLDLGIASVGWAVLEDDYMGKPKRIVKWEQEYLILLKTQKMDLHLH